MIVLKGTKVYHLPEGVKARREAFGLLFYNSADARLTFVGSGSLLDVERAEEGMLRLRLSCKEDLNGESGKLERLIETLLKKGVDR